MKKQQTAVEWFASEIRNHNELPSRHFEELLEQAKEIEKEQIINAFGEGNSKAKFEFKILNGRILRFESDMPFDGEQYYNEAYGTPD